MAVVAETDGGNTDEPVIADTDGGGETGGEILLAVSMRLSRSCQMVVLERDNVDGDTWTSSGTI